MKDFHELVVWQKAHKLTLDVYRATGHFPREEVFGLTSQLRRAAASIPANIAEGCGRSGEAEFARFLHIAAGSANEVEYHLLLARDLTYLSEEEYKRLASNINEIKRMLASLITKIKTHQNQLTKC